MKPEIKKQIHNFFIVLMMWAFVVAIIYLALIRLKQI